MTTLITFSPARFLNPHNAGKPVPVIISSCLYGEPVRYDGTPRALTELALLRDNLALQPLCPETGAGLSVPRPPVQLVAAVSEPVRVLGRDDQRLDVTAALTRFAVASANALQQQRPRPAGYLWKSRSPSCGWGTTPLFDRAGKQRAVGDGIQAAQIRAALPWLVCSDEQTVATPAAAAQFVLLCRLVNDVVNETRPLAALRAAHGPLAALLAAEVREQLLGCIERDDRIGYATVLAAAGVAGEPEPWLEAFGQH